MLTNTFCHLSRIGHTTERNLWAAGVTSWQSLPPLLGCRVPRTIVDAWPTLMEESMAMHAARDARYFARRLPTSQRWRLYGDFATVCAFLDIETTGLSQDAKITTIVLYDGRTIRHYVNGRNLDDFARDVNDYRLLVTYGGASFDIPFIQRHFHVQLSQAHIDLRFPLRSLGFEGGLKACEHSFGLHRTGCEDIDGVVAGLLWHVHMEENNEKALETLLAYNAYDAITLQALMVHAYNGRLASTPFANLHRLPDPELPQVPFRADRVTVDEMHSLARRYWPSLGAFG
jgi:uncharacterized protein